MNIAQNIAYGEEKASFEDIVEAATKVNIHDFITELPEGYETKVGSKGSDLSGGQKQHIAIAGTIHRKPKVLLLDEATSVMDSNNEQIIQQTLDKVQNKDPTRTSLIITHRLSIIRFCDLICVLQTGYVVESGNHDELIQKRGIYYNMYNQNTAV